MNVTQLGYLGLGVSNLAAWRDFACNVLGFQESDRGKDGQLQFRIDANHHRFEVVESKDDDVIFVGWEVKDEAALALVADRVRSEGIAVRNGSPDEAAARMVLGLAKFTDPNGIPVELYFGPCLDSRPFISPCGTTGFRAGNLGLGHIVVNVDDLDKSLGFYQRALGVRVSDFVSVAVPGMDFRVKLGFTHVNSRHHSLAMVRLPPIPGLPSKRLNHFMVEANSLDDVGRALARFQERGLPADQLGKHTNDHMVSFYAPTPSGFMVEYGCGGRTIDSEDDWEVQYYTAASFWGHGPAPQARPVEKG